MDEQQNIPVSTGNSKKVIFFIVAGILILVVVAVAIWFLTKDKQRDPGASVDSNTTTEKMGNGNGNGTREANDSGQRSQQTAASPVTWMQTENGWRANTSSALPVCPNPVLQTPTNLAEVTSILYPGQTRGGQYKPHGGFRFDNAKTNDVTVTAPMDAVIVDGGRYLVNGEAQYMFDFISPCGIMYRIGHLLTLDPKFQAIADIFPAPQEMDSRTERLSPQIEVKAGETIATAVGVTKGGVNVFFDFGVFDVTKKNDKSNDAAWAAKPEHDPELAQHALCWFDLLPTADSALVKGLPGGDAAAGKASDFCN